MTYLFLQENLKSLINSGYNINIHGPDGCGKTYLIHQIFNLDVLKSETSSKKVIYLSLPDFVNKQSIFGELRKGLIDSCDFLLKILEEENEFNEEKTNEEDNEGSEDEDVVQRIRNIREMKERGRKSSFIRK